ncbi:MAG: hypothetical protein PF517_00660 [Salinivirgaceae bacterium]|jgi:hypothetical protein|nr:hypothetical protein [Salinivirgaceae bacterium]
MADKLSYPADIERLMHNSALNQNIYSVNGNQRLDIRPKALITLA